MLRRVAVVFFAAGLVSGCSGSGGSPGPATEPPPPEPAVSPGVRQPALLFLFHREYLAPPGDMGPGTAGFVASTLRLDDGEWVFDPAIGGARIL